MYYLYYLVENRGLEFGFLSDKIISSWVLLVFAICLMPINWILETIKWRNLVIEVQRIDFLEAIQSVLAGILLSLLTPNRIGELGGKLIYIKKENRTTVLYLNTVSSISQLLITCIIGIWAVFVIRDFIQFKIIFNDYLLFGVILITTMLLIFTYFFSNRLSKIVSYFSKKKTSTFIRINSKQRLQLFSYSMLRYLVFCIQFFILVQIFEPSITFSESSLLIALIFFFTALIPTGWISDLPVRTSIAFFIFELLGYNGTYGLASSFLLWLVNLLIPALFSLFLLRKVNWMGIIKSNRE
ncbi:MAG: hypothetical protein DWP98_00975 [Bacteroidetes bacterium]|nr:MAG: hypothetical protein DWP98_00975 [Bacteroidota bacterium]MBL1143869.1 hypothetical protein [Bacteroidota bacterium]NOG56670.1 hypothetical protein [Bacteroidota bacterium]